MKFDVVYVVHVYHETAFALKLMSCTNNYFSINVINIFLEINCGYSVFHF